MQGKKQELNKPSIGVGAVVFHNKKVLLVKRKNPPAKGQWAIPGGKLEWGETLQRAAEREIREETGIVIKAGDPVFTFEVIDRNAHESIRYHYVIVDLEAKYVSGTLKPGDDAVDAQWIGENEIPQLEINARTVELLLKYFDPGLFKLS